MTDYDKRQYLRYPAELNEMVNVYYLDEDLLNQLVAIRESIYN